MQLSIEIPEQLGNELKSLKNYDQFIVTVLEKALAETRAKQNLKQAIADLQQQAEKSGLSNGELEKLLND